MFRRRDATETRQARLDESEEFLQVICAGFNLDRRTARRFFYDDPYFEVNQRWGLWLRGVVRVEAGLRADRRAADDSHRVARCAVLRDFWGDDAA
jgi:hypothetical protein